MTRDVHVFQVRRSMVPYDQHSSVWELREHVVVVWECVSGAVEKVSVNVPAFSEHYMPGMLSAYVDERFTLVEEFDRQLEKATEGRWNHERIEEVLGPNK